MSDRIDDRLTGFLYGDGSINECICKWRNARFETIVQIRCLGEKMADIGKSVKIASAVGNGVAIGAGVSAAICFLVIPVTLGASALAGGVLAGISAAGAVTSVGAKITNEILEKGLRKDIERALGKDNVERRRLKEIIGEMQSSLPQGEDNVRTVNRITKGVFELGRKIPTGINGVAVAGRLILKNADEAVEFLTKLGHSARFAGAVITFVTLPVDIYFFVRDVIDLHKGNFSKAATHVMDFADELHEEIMEFDQLFLSD